MRMRLEVIVDFPDVEDIDEVLDYCQMTYATPLAAIMDQANGRLTSHTLRIGQGSVQPDAVWTCMTAPNK